jgi:gamma-glutamyltranspeptidase / glutathione hydrolase
MVMARGGMAATSHPLSTLTAVNVLQSGGNAMDAAVAACAVQCVVEPGSTGVGGDCFVLYAPAGGRLIGFNGSGRAPAAASADWYMRNGITAIERQTPHAVTIPGAVDAWAQLIRDHGTCELGGLLQPAIRLADDGYAITPRVAFDWERHADLMRADPDTQRVFLPGGAPPSAGAVHHQPEMSATLRAIAKDGRDAFYRGEIAADLVERLQSLGGLHTMEDFAAARGVYVTPIKTEFRGFDVYECPPNGQGLTALILLNILSGFAPDADPNSVERIHLELEAGRLAYSVRDEMIADPDASYVPIEWMLSHSFADQLRAGIDRHRASNIRPVPAPREHADTVYITVVDKDRNAVSFINSLFGFFGSGIMGPRSGVLLQNRGQGFTLTPGHPNAIAPGKRPLHTIIPGMVMRDGAVRMSFGVMGGHYQAMGNAHFLSRVIDYGMDMQSAIETPRYFPRPGTSIVEVEGTVPSTTIDELKRRGFKVVRPEIPLGGAQAIWIERSTDVLLGASDPRKDGCAMGF